MRLDRVKPASANRSAEYHWDLDPTADVPTPT